MAGKSEKSSGALKRPEPWVDPDDSPEWTDAMLDRAVIRHGDTVIHPGAPAEPMMVELQLDQDVLAAYRALGSGWQTMINDDLRKARKLEPKRKMA